MLSKDIINAIKKQMPDYLDMKGIQTNRNFCCINPRHDDYEPSMRYDPVKFAVHCFGCGNSYDVIDLIKMDYNCGFKEAVDIAANLFHIPMISKSSYSSTRKISADVNISEGLSVPAESKKDETKKKDLTNYYIKCRDDLEKTDYLQKRGIDINVAKKMYVGYDKSLKIVWIDESGYEKSKNGCLIFPCSKYSFTYRSVSIDVPKKARYRVHGRAGIFNRKILAKTNEVVFVTEGEIDALSVLTCGYPAIALGGASNRLLLVKFLQQNRINPHLGIMLDNDESGYESCEQLCKNLTNLGINHFISNLYEEFPGCKDPNDCLLSDPEKFKAILREDSSHY